MVPWSSDHGARRCTGLRRIVCDAVHPAAGDTMIQIFNSAINYDERTELPLSAVKIQEQNICKVTARPYILFEHGDYPLGALKAEYNGEVWICDLC